MLGVLFDSDVEERGPQPLQSHRDVSDRVEHNLSIQVLYQMVVEAGEKVINNFKAQHKSK